MYEILGNNNLLNRNIEGIFNKTINNNKYNIVRLVSNRVRGRRDTSNKIIRNILL